MFYNSVQLIDQLLILLKVCTGKVKNVRKMSIVDDLDTTIEKLVEDLPKCSQTRYKGGM